MPLKPNMSLSNADKKATGYDNIAVPDNVSIHWGGGNKLVFLLHGMGTYVDLQQSSLPPLPWHNSWVEVLKKMSSAYDYSYFKSQQIWSEVTFVPITYDFYFVKYWRDLVADNFGSLGGLKDAIVRISKDPQTPIAMRWADKFPDDLEQVEDDAWNSHWMDVLLWYATPFRRVIMLYVQEYLMTARLLAEDRPSFKGNKTEISIIAHSLGTSVIHDSIADAYDDSKNKYLKPTPFRIKNLFQVANVSRILERDFHYGSPPMMACVPGSSFKNRYFLNYMNMRHLYDPFTWYRTADAAQVWTPKDRPEAQVAVRRLAKTNQLTNENFTIFELHTMEHYLHNPKVHVPILRGLFGANTIPDAEFEKAQKVWATSASRHLEAAEVKQIAERFGIKGFDAAVDSAFQAKDVIDSLATESGQVSLDALLNAANKLKQLPILA